MKVHTKNYKDVIKTIGRQLDSKIIYELNGVTQTLTSEKLNSITPTFQGALLKSTMKELDIDSNVDIPIGTILKYQFGVKVGNEYEYLDYGNYIVYSSEKQEDYDSYKIVCYDKMLYSMKTNEDLGITYPISVRDYINALCTKIGLEFKNKEDEFANYDKMINEELYLGQDYTYRDIFDELAQVTGSIICLDNDDKVEIRYISSNATDTIDENFLKDTNINFGQKYGPVNSIVLSRSAESDNVFLQNKESVEANGLCEIKIKNNQIMNFNDRSDYLVDLLEKLNGLEYYLNDFVSTGITYYDLCDRYNVKIGNNTYSCVMFNDEIEITQGLVENIHTDMPEETQTDYTKADKTDRKINTAYIIVDKQQQEITSLTHQTQTIQDNLNNNYYTISQTNTLVQTAEQGVTNTFSEAGGNNIFRNTGLWYENDEYNVDNSYISKNLGDLLCTLNDRQYTKTYNGLAYISYYYDGEYTYPLLIGFTPESVVYTALDTRLDQYTTTIYNNITYYVSATIFAMGGNWTSTEGKANKLSEEAITREEAISIMLSKIGNFSPYEFWNGNVIKTSNSKSANSYSFMLQEGILSQEQVVSNGNYTASFKYKKLIELANVKVKINDIEYNLNELTDTEFVTGQTNNEGEYITQPLVVSSQHINIQFISDTNNACEIYDIMVNAGTVKLAYSQNQNETTTDTVNISKGITINSSTTSTTFKANARGIKTIDKNNNTLTEFTDTGMTTKEQIVKNKAQICNVLIQPIGNQTWFTKI